MKKKIVIINIVLLTFILLFLIGMQISLNDEKSKFLNKTLEIKELLLKEKTENTKSILGKLYIKDSEKILSNIELVLYKETNDEYTKSAIVYTDEFGNYKFSDLDIGNYKIKLETKEDYKIINEDQIIQITSEITTKNIDIEVKETDVFKAQISKYIKQINLVTDGKETKYDYNKESKVLIPLKNVKKISGTVLYEFDIENVKQVDGFVKVIKDKIPEGLSFDKNKNPQWKEKNGYLYTTQLSKEILKVGQTKKVTLILDILNTNEAKAYLNSVSITGEIYHKVTFINLGDIYAQFEVLDGDTSIEEVVPVLLGFKFTGWYKDSKATQLFDFAEPITEDTTIYAGWKKEINVTYMVDNEVYKQETLYQGDKTIKPADPQKEGYEFVNWYKDSEFNQEYDFNSTLTEDLILYGKLKENIINYTVTYMIENSEFAKETLKSGSLIENKQGPIKSNKEKETRVSTYSFDGWYADEELTNRYDFTQGINKNIILYGKYIENSVCKTKTNIYIPTKDSIINSLNINKINITETTESGNVIIANNFVAQYDSSNQVYNITGYNGNYPNDLVLPDMINGKDVVSVTGIGNGQTFDSVKISSTVKNITGSFNSATISNKLDFSEAINLQSINQSFQGVNVDVFNLENSINLTSINSMQGITCDTFNFGNTLSLERLENNTLTGLTANNLDFGKAVNLKYIGSSNSMYVETINLSNLVSLEEIATGAFSGTLDSNGKGAGSIKKVILNSDLKKLGSFSFNANKIEQVDYECAKNSLEEIQSGVFSYNNLSIVELSDFSNLSKLDLSAYGNNTLDKFELKNIPTLTNLTRGGPHLYFSDIGEVILDNIGITTIDDLNFFSGGSNVQSITIKNNVNMTAIDELLYNDEASLRLENLPNLKTIGYEVGLNAYVKDDFILEDLPELETISEWAFYNTYFDNIIIRNLPKLKEIGPGAFRINQCVRSGGDGVVPTHTITLSNLPLLEKIDDEAFIRCGITNITFESLPKLKEIGTGAFRITHPLSLSLTSENVPNLEKIDAEAFFLPNSDSMLDLTISGLSKLDTTSVPLFRIFYGSGGLSNITVENSSVTNIGTPTIATVKNIKFKDCENLILDQLLSRNIENLELDNLPSVTSIPSTAFVSNSLTQLDLSKLQNLTEIQSIAFAGNSRLTTVKLPASLLTIGDNAFSSDSNINCIEIQGDSTRFNDRWEAIGLSSSLTPSTCVFMNTPNTNLLANIFNTSSLSNELEKTYNIVLYKMDDNTLIDNEKEYKIQMLKGDTFIDMKVSEDIENVGRYIVDNNSDDLIKSFNNKVYITNIESGTYRLIEKGNEEKVLTFIIESNGDITGYVKISNISNTDKIMSQSEAEFITTIQTGAYYKYILYVLFGILIILSLVILFRKKEKLS